jgi:uncharacterized protein (TIGR02996 family)
VTTEDDFQRALDARPNDWQTRLVFADWLQERGDTRAPGYRAIAVQRLRPLNGRNRNLDAWWWCSQAGNTCHNIVPQDWFVLLSAGPGSKLFWPVFTATGGNKSRGECEDALALAFVRLPPDRQNELITPPAPTDAGDPSAERGARNAE